MARLGSRATSAPEKGGRESSRWEWKSRGANAGVSLLGGGREGERDAGGWGAMAEQWDKAAGAACVCRGLGKNLCMNCLWRQARELGMGPIFLASDRSTLYLVLAIDGLTLSMNIYSDRQQIAK